MRWNAPAIAIALLAVAADAAAGEQVLMLNEPRDVYVAKHACQWADDEIKQDQYLIKAHQCGESELCQRAIDISAACKVTGPDADVRGFHRKLLAQFASNPHCTISIMRLTQGKSAADVDANLEAFKHANWELNLGYRPGASSQGWSLWPVHGRPADFLEGEGDPARIASDVCTIMTRSGAKIEN